ncbi:hypothetical protein AGMMS49992_07410 [Clostridia bacterium]|nr:hypothetical protein AGMMS49992_07410 [Clostridia bacterium]
MGKMAEAFDAMYAKVNKLKAVAVEVGLVLDEIENYGKCDGYLIEYATKQAREAGLKDIAADVEKACSLCAETAKEWLNDTLQELDYIIATDYNLSRYNERTAMITDEHYLLELAQQQARVYHMFNDIPAIVA